MPGPAPADPVQWRAWLAEHGTSSREIWLTVRRGGGSGSGLGYDAAIEQALCFGWIDSHARTGEDGASKLRFTPRSSTSTWSRVNRDRADRLQTAGLMAPEGQREIERAKAAGRWRAPGEDGEPLPADLQAGLDTNPAAQRHFDAFPPSSRRLILVWIASARRTETRHRRIDRAVELAGLGIPANHPVHRPPRP